MTEKRNWRPKFHPVKRICANCGEELKKEDIDTTVPFKRYSFCKDCVQLGGENLVRSVAEFMAKKIYLASISRKVLKENTDHQRKVTSLANAWFTAKQLSLSLNLSPVEALPAIIKQMEQLDLSLDSLKGVIWGEVGDDILSLEPEPVTGVTYDSLEYGTIAWCSDCNHYLFGKSYGTECCHHDNLKVVVPADQNQGVKYLPLDSLLSTAGKFSLLNVSIATFNRIKDNPQSILCCRDDEEAKATGCGGVWLFVTPDLQNPNQRFQSYGSIVF